MQRDLPGARVTLRPLTAEDTLRLVHELAGDRPIIEEGALVAASTGRDTQSVPGPVLDAPSPVATLSRWLYAETGGQPFYIVETLKALLERGAIALQLRADGSWVLDAAAVRQGHDLRRVIPPGVREVIRGRLARLSPAAVGLLAASAVLGRAFDFERVRQVAELTENDALAALDEVLARMLVHEDSERAAVDATYFFTHDKIRDVVYAEAGAARRRVLHRRALRILQEAGAPAAELAYHALAAGLPAEAMCWSVAAGDAAMRVFALHDTVDHYEQARRLVEKEAGMAELPGGRSADLQHLYLQLGRAYELNGDFTTSREVYEALQRLGQQLADTALECAALNRLATLTAQESADMEGAALLLRLAQQVAEASGDRIWLAETEWNLAQLSYYTWDIAETLAHGQRALALARELGQSELIARSLNVVAYAEWFTHCCVLAEAHADEVRALYAALGNRAMEADCLTLMAHARLDRGQMEGAIDAARAAQTISQAIQNHWGQAFSAVTLTLGLLQRGVYGDGLEVAQQGTRLAQMHGPPMLRFLTLLCLGTVQRVLFALEAAQEAHQEALAGVEAMGSPPPIVAMVAAELCADCVVGEDWDRAYDYALRVLTAGERGYPMLPGSPTIWYETVALLRGGGHEQARIHVQRFAASVDGNERYRVAYLRVLAALAEAEGATDKAITYLREAANLAETLGLPGEQWQIEAALGVLYRTPGEAAQARQTAARAAELVRNLADTLNDAARQAAFLGSPAVQRVLEQS